jgi:hypothetical protein
VDFHNLVRLGQMSTELICENLKNDDYNSFLAVVKKLNTIPLSNEHHEDTQMLYLFLIVKLNRFIRNNDLGHPAVSKEVIQLLLKIKSVEFARLSFYDILPLRHFKIVYDYFKDLNIDTTLILANNHTLLEFEKGELIEKNTIEDVFSDYYESNGSYYATIPDDLINIVEQIGFKVAKLDFSKVLSLDSLLDEVLGVFDLHHDINANIFILPLVFHDSMKLNPNKEDLQREYFNQLMDEFWTLSNSICILAVVFSSLKLKNIDKDSMIKHLKKIILNLPNDRFDKDIMLECVLNCIYVNEGPSVMEDWLIEIFKAKFNFFAQNYIQDQKYQVLIDRYWLKSDWKEQLTQYLSPMFHAHYFVEAQTVMEDYLLDENLEQDKSVIDLSEQNLSPNDFLLHDLGETFKWGIMSYNSPVSVKNIEFEKIIPMLSQVSSTTLYLTMHKIFLKDLIYNNCNLEDLPKGVLEFYNLSFCKELKANSN